MRNLKSILRGCSLAIALFLLALAPVAQAQNTFEDQTKIAEAAMAEGKLAPAAEAFAKAYEIKPTDQLVGLKAALIYVEKLDEPLKAAPILWTLAKNGAKPEYQDLLKALQQRIAPQVEESYKTWIQTAIVSLRGDYLDAATTQFGEALKIRPDGKEGFVGLARTQAKAAQIPKVKETIRLAVGVCKVSVTDVFSYAAPELVALIADKEFAPFIPETFGADWQTKIPSLARRSESLKKFHADLKATQEPQVNPFDGSELIYIPEGKFLRGNNESSGDQKPQAEITINAYWMAKKEVTVAQYRTFCQETGRDMPAPPSWGWQDEHPVVNVSWNDAVDYCNWAGMRLPTEAEWEKAARGTDGRIYPWGNKWDVTKLRFSRKVYGDALSPANVGSYPMGASPFGLLDMSGNVWEWCSDWYSRDYYAESPAKNPKGPSRGRSRVVRGGSWRLNLPDLATTYYRHFYPADSGFNNFGFRCAAG